MPTNIHIWRSLINRLSTVIHKKSTLNEGFFVLNQRELFAALGFSTGKRVDKIKSPKFGLRVGKSVILC
jgi:hypothetical protein